MKNPLNYATSIFTSKEIEIAIEKMENKICAYPACKNKLTAKDKQIVCKECQILTNRIVNSYKQ